MADFSKIKKLVKYADPIATKISDWIWRPLSDVKKDVPITAVPDYVQSGYGQFMKEQAKRAAAGDLNERDLLKAYLITQSSIGRGGLSHATATKAGLKVPKADEIRPEGAFATWLGSPAGQRYLTAAERGEVDQKALEDIRQKFAPFGKQNQLVDTMTDAVTTIPSMTAELNAAISGGANDYRNFAERLNGIAAAKSGFVGSLLGRGDLPTFDARQIGLHTSGMPMPTASAGSMLSRGKGLGGREAVDRLAARQKNMGLDIDPLLDPHYQHLTHHAIWDALGGEKTTHQDLIDAMKNYSEGGPVHMQVGGLSKIPSLVRAVGQATSKAKPFYSAVDEAISKITQNKGNSDQFLAMIRNAPGVKSAEIADRKLGALLTGKGKMTKAQLQEIAAKNPAPQIVEREIGDKAFDARVEQITDELVKDKEFSYRQMGEDPKSAAYLAESEREDLFKQAHAKVMDEGGYDPQHQKWSSAGGQNYREILIKLPKGDYVAGHYKDANVLAHARVQDRTGPNGEKILHIEEIQSDWHQKGRKSGYQKITTAEANAQASELEKQGRQIEYKAATENERPLTAAESEEYINLQRMAAQLRGEANVGVPDAPFKKNWHELVLKRLVDDAARNGYDKVVITPGAEQAKRYDLSKQIRSLEYEQQPDGRYHVIAITNNGDSRLGGFYKAEELPNIVGKDVSERIVFGEGAASEGNNYKELSGVDLQVGGEGMKGFYDEIIPSSIKNMYGKHGVKLGTHDIEGAEGVVPYHSFDITPQLRESIIEKGQPLYMAAPLGVAVDSALEQEEPAQQRKGGAVNQDAMNMAVWNKGLGQGLDIRGMGDGLAPYGLRHGTPTAKSKGYFGLLPASGGQVSSEISAESDVGEYPLMVPTLNREELGVLLSGGRPTDAIYQKAEAWAKRRQEGGQSPFAGGSDYRYPLPESGGGSVDAMRIAVMNKQLRKQHG